MSLTETSALLWVMGFVIGLGAVSVIEILGFLGQRSGYWTEATIRAHKVTKPLIWLGLTLAVIGGVWFYLQTGVSTFASAFSVLLPIMLINGAWLTFWISPRLLKRERAGKSSQLLPGSWKLGITLSFLISVLTWWTALALTVITLVRY